MLRRRIIPCLDIKDGRTVKGTNFVDIKDAGDPIALARNYSALGADELVLLDISATLEQRATMIDIVRRVGQEVNIPFTVGGGIGSTSQAYDILQQGADKVSVNSAAIRRPELISELAKLYGSQCVVVAIDARKIDRQWTVHSHGGQRRTNLTLIDWAVEVQERGCGEVLFTSMDHDGTKAGYAIEALQKLTKRLSIPVIASGGAGNTKHIVDVFEQTAVTGALAASIFHYQEVSIAKTKAAMLAANIPTRALKK